MGFSSGRRLRPQITREAPTSQPPTEQDPRSLYRDELFRTCLPTDTLPEHRRVARVRELLHSDLRDNSVEFYSPEQDPDLDKWAEKLSHLLVPQATPLFARHRWLTSAKAVYNLVFLS